MFVCLCVSACKAVGIGSYLRTPQTRDTVDTGSAANAAGPRMLPTRDHQLLLMLLMNSDNNPEETTSVLDVTTNGQIKQLHSDYSPSRLDCDVSLHRLAL